MNLSSHKTVLPKGLFFSLTKLFLDSPRLTKEKLLLSLIVISLTITGYQATAKSEVNTPEITKVVITHIIS